MAINFIWQKGFFPICAQLELTMPNSPVTYCNREFVMPWKEHQLQFRIEAFNFTNTQHFSQPGGPNSVTINAGCRAVAHPVRAEIQLLAGVWAPWPEERNGPGGGKHELRL